MPKFKKTEDQLESELDEWLFILKNLRKLDEIPVPLKGNDVYERVFEVAKVGNLTPEEMNEYQQSLKKFNGITMVRSAMLKKRGLLKDLNLVSTKKRLKWLSN